MWASGVFALALSGLLAHELDAVSRREWTLLFVLRRMDEERARLWFIALHVPLVAVILWGLRVSPEATMGAVDVFLIVHAGLHWRLRFHPECRFRGVLSPLLIYAPAVLGAAHLLWLRA